MLTIHPINNITYYDNDDYYLNDASPEDVWIGCGAEYLNLNNKPVGEEYHHLARGYSPNGKIPLCKQAGDDHRPGWDLTFSAPKSVSLAWAMANEHLRKEISNAQLKSVRQAIILLEKNAAYTRRGINGKSRERTHALIVRALEHSTSRALDVSLHTHGLVQNLSPRLDGSFGTIISRDLYLWQKAAGAIYRAELSHQMKKLGFEIEPDGESFRLTIIPEQACHNFSKRSQTINERLKKCSATTSASRIGNSIKITTRAAKQKIERDGLLQKWRSELDSYGLNNELLKKHLSARYKPSEAKTAFEIPEIISSLTNKNAVFRKQDVYRAIAETAQWNGEPAAIVNQLAKSILTDEELVSLGTDSKHNQLFSTKQMLRLENEILEITQSLTEKYSHALQKNIVNDAISLHEKQCGYTLTKEQSEGLFYVCCEGDFSILQGSAGAGKSSAMAALHSAYSQQGLSVIGAAIAKKAADNLAEESRITSYTVAKLLSDAERGRNHFSLADVLVVDEAGQLGTKQLNALLHLAQEHNVKVILVGEDKQLDAIELGGCLRFLSQKLNCSRIEEIKRQRESWARTAVMHLRDGLASKALSAFQAKGLLNFSESSKDTQKQMVNAWESYHRDNPNKNSLLLAQRWKDVDQLSTQMRTILQSQGKVGNEEVEVDCIVSEHRCNQRFAVGDRIKMCKNDYRLSVSNGSMGKITNIYKSNDDIVFTVLLDSGHTVSVSRNNYQNEEGRLPMVLGYALTVYASQGTTIDGDVFVYWTSGMDRANSYVAGSRHKDNCHWFFNSREIDLVTQQAEGVEISDEIRVQTVAQVMSSERRKSMALEYLDTVNKPTKNIQLESYKGDVECDSFEPIV
ncbi:relaxase domain-containing protein [Vibrio makurazakiensis]|uniref:MobF family relaxase n=1 Tax=Vibrio makurazakiensis TaxID=2910250 RepID=UPI003D0A876F